MTNAFTHLGGFAKQAAGMDPQLLEQQLGDEAMRRVGYIGAAALGVGAGLRGVKGLWNMVQRHANPPKPKYPQAMIARVPVPVEDDVTDPKLAADKAAGITDYTAMPWFLPAATAATGLGAYGGWKGVDAILNKQQQAEKDDELNSAKSDFEAAMLDSYARPRRLGRGSVLKTAGDELGELLDALYDAAVEKRALFGDVNWDNVKGRLMGGYGAYALATAVPAAYWAYNRADAGSERNVVAKAEKLRARRAALTRPPEVYAVPEPVRVGGRSGIGGPGTTGPADVAEAESQAPGFGGSPAMRRRVDFLGE